MLVKTYSLNIHKNRENFYAIAFTTIVPNINAQAPNKRLANK